SCPHCSAPHTVRDRQAFGYYLPYRLSTITAVLSAKSDENAGSADMNDAASTSLSVLRDWSVPDAIGVLGLMLYLGSYLALQLGLIRGDDWVFPSFILAAALCMIVSLTARFNPFSMLVEVSWAVISGIGLIRLYIIHKYSFSAEEQAAAKRLGPGLAKDRVRKLLSLGNWRNMSPGHVMTREGLPVTHLIYVASGICRIVVVGRKYAR